MFDSDALLTPGGLDALLVALAGVEQTEPAAGGGSAVAGTGPESNNVDVGLGSHGASTGDTSTGDTSTGDTTAPPTPPAPMRESTPARLLSDAERIDVLTALERVKAAVGAAQVRVTAGFVASQEQASIGWRAQSEAALDANDFDGWLDAREKADLASWAAALEFGAHADTRGKTASDDSDLGAAGSDGSAGSAGAGEPERRPSSSRRNLIAKGGVAAQVALARHLSPFKGAEGIRFSLTLSHDMPHALALLEAGVLSEWRALSITKEAAILSPEHRRLLDQELHDTYGERLGGLGDRELSRLVRGIAYRLDPESVLRRARKAESERKVTMKSAPDTMAYLTALLPAAEAVAAYAALTGAAASAKAAGDERGKGQVMADTLVDRVTGRAASEPDATTTDEIPADGAAAEPAGSAGSTDGSRTAGESDPVRGSTAPAQEPTGRAGVDVEVQLVMGLDALFNTGDGADTPAQLLGYGTVPAGWAREYLRPADTHHPDDPDDPLADPGGGQVSDRGGGLSRAGRVWIRRLFVRPDTGELVAMDSRRRLFSDGLRRFVLTRDAATCRTPWCDAPARHVDHVTPHADGGPTSAANGQGLCVACNLTKEHPDLTSTTLPRNRRSVNDGGNGHTVRVTTGTGHSYESVAPVLLPGAPSPQPSAPQRPHDSGHPFPTLLWPLPVDPTQRPTITSDSAVERWLQQLIDEASATPTPGA
ncbi:5-methylcytosine-specific restriction endonuclease McrA [Terracoccus luteus]|uniref:5-methylcytosine-specific restriction endonuclease McrA n=1 Tax=Terracoccus luteus TaxID=53356 RepID=A0A495XZM0_9MICO|nr:HNH endonuclease signature motif containing protein [Terracoccus luteus]RKT79747.1 5-methylcytosine-specific restriction endonuclease McrA [Terracoccus luteus]